MVLGANLEFQESFHSRIKKFFINYHFTLLDLNKLLDSFKGKDCQAFVKNTTSLAYWIEKTPLLMTKNNCEWEGIIGALCRYKKINDFMAKTIIKDKEVEQYKKDMNEFKNNLINFHKHGKHLFLKYCHAKIGGGKTEYWEIFTKHVCQENTWSL